MLFGAMLHHCTMVKGLASSLSTATADAAGIIMVTSPLLSMFQDIIMLTLSMPRGTHS